MDKPIVHFQNLYWGKLIGASETLYSVFGKRIKTFCEGFRFMHIIFHSCPSSHIVALFFLLKVDHIEEVLGGQVVIRQNKIAGHNQ